MQEGTSWTRSVSEVVRKSFLATGDFTPQTGPCCLGPGLFFCNLIVSLVKIRLTEQEAEVYKNFYNILL